MKAGEAAVLVEDLALVRAELDRRCGLRTELVSDAQLAQAVGKAAVGAGSAGVAEFIRALCLESQQDGPLLQHLIRRVTIGETSFFRHPDDLQWLSDHVLPRLLDAREARGDLRLRMWSAGCASGEEAYSLAALALQQIEKRASRASWQVSVLATDINSDALGMAQRAEYGEWSFRGVSAADRTRWFEPAGERWRPVEAIRRPVSLAYLNLRDPIYPAIMTGTSALDLIVCRNVFIYFFPSMIVEVLRRFQECLVADGHLLCGPSDLFDAELPTGLQRSREAPHRVGRGTSERPEGARPIPLAPARRAAQPKPGLASPKPGAVSPKPAVVTPLAPDRAATDTGLALLQRGRYREAAEWARAALTRAELSLPHRHCLALALSAQNAPEALAAWKDLLYLSPEDPEVHLGLGFTLLRAQRTADAQRHFRSVLQYLGSRGDDEHLPGPDALKVGWVRAACRSLAKGSYRGRTV